MSEKEQQDKLRKLTWVQENSIRILMEYEALTGALSKYLHGNHHKLVTVTKTVTGHRYYKLAQSQEHWTPQDVRILLPFIVENQNNEEDRKEEASALCS